MKRILVWMMGIFFASALIAQTERNYSKNQKTENKKEKLLTKEQCRNDHYDMWTGYNKNSILDEKALSKIKCKK